MKVTVVGTGYVGLATATTLAYLGNDLTCLDVDVAKIHALKQGEVPFHEPHLDSLLALVRDRITFTTSTEEAIQSANVIFIAVGTPSSADGSADLSYLGAAAKQIGAWLSQRFTVVVNKSTVPVGCANWVEALVRQGYADQNGGYLDGHLGVASNPEFLREGSALQDTLYADRIVIGADDSRTIDVLRELYKPIEGQTFEAPSFLPRQAGFSRVPVIATGLASAELIKYAANAFLASKISFINEISRLAECIGADVRDVATGIGSDRRIGHGFLQAGIGWGGSCFGKDTAALISIGREYGLAMPIVEAARCLNSGQRDLLIGKLMAELKILKGRTVGLLGLAFKPNTDDLRDAPALHIARRLIELGVRVKAHDPAALRRASREHGGVGITFCETPEQVAEEAHALVLMTEWDDYKHLPWETLASRMRKRILIDGRNFLDRCELEHAGFRYVGFGV